MANNNGGGKQEAKDRPVRSHTANSAAGGCHTEHESCMSIGNLLHASLEDEGDLSQLQAGSPRDGVNFREFQ